MTSSTSVLAAADQQLHEHPEQAAGPVIAVKDWGFNAHPVAGRVLATLCTFIERLCALVLAVDVLVVFVSVILRYFVHHPVDWAEEVARGLMVMLVFLGGATVLARKQHVHVDFFRALLPAAWQQAAHQIGGCWWRAQRRGWRFLRGCCWKIRSTWPRPWACHSGSTYCRCSSARC